MESFINHPPPKYVCIFFGFIKDPKQFPSTVFSLTEGPSHSVSGAGATKSQSGAGYKKRTAPPTGEEAHGDRQTGQAIKKLKVRQCC